MPANESIELRSSGTFIADGVGVLIDRISGVLKAERFDGIVGVATTLGHWTLLLVAVLGLIVQLVATVGYGGSAILWGVGWLILLPLLQYTAVQFMDATRSMVTSNMTTLGSQAFLRCYALVSLVAAIVALIAGIVAAIEAGGLPVFLSGLAVAALAVGTAWLALNPSLLAIRVNRQTSAGEEAIGVLSFFVKSGVRLVPIFYGVAMVVVAIQAIVILLGMIGDTRPELMMAVGRAELAAPVVIWAVLSPFLAYIAFVFYFLVIDLMRGILSIPGNIGAHSGGSSGKKRSASTRKRSSSGKKRSASRPASSSGGAGGSSSAT